VVSEKRPDNFEERAQAVLQESAEQLDGRTRSRLTQARHAALEAAQKTQTRGWHWLMPAGGTVAAAVLAVMLSTSGAHRDAEQMAVQPVDEFEIAAAEDSIEFYRDVEFYVWLDTVLEDEPAERSGA
jgi:hypothetical protein